MSCFGGSIGSSSSNCGRANERVVAHIPYTNMPNSTNITLPHLSLSLVVKNRMENIGLLEGDFDPSILGKLKEDENESKSGSDNFEGASGDDQDTVAARDNDEKGPRRKKYHRHTPQQIQELEAFFKECPHPDEKQRLDLSRRLSLETKQVKFWFQNRRTQLKTQMERHENLILRQENDRLRLENIAIKDAMRNPMCNNCGGAALMGDISYEENNLRIENARLKDELGRICSLADKFLGRSISSLVSTIPPPGPNSSSELAVGSDGFGGLNSIGSSATLPIGIDYRDGIPGSSPMVPLTRQITSLPCIDMQLERSILLELALTAMDELVKKAQIDNPLWIRSLDGGKEILNQEEYMRTFPPCIGMKPGNFVSEATRESSAVNINSLALVEMLMDVNRWVEMFPCLIARASTTDVISPGMNGTRNGALQLMFAELQVLSPLVPSRQVRFLRFCKHHAEGVWAVVDVSIDTIQDGSNGQTFFYCRRLPSGFVVQDMPNGFSKVIWVEHSEYDESAIHPLYRQVIGSGIGFGARRWIATLQSQCECLAILMSSAISAEDNTRLSQAISSAGKRSMFKLTQRMIDNFCAEVCASSVHKWEKLEAVNIGEDVRVMTRKSLDDPGDPPGVLLGAATSVWMPITMQRLFDFLRDERMRSEWDILSNGGLMQEMVNIAKGQNDGNSVSLLRSNTMDVNENSMIILQETRTDPSGSLVVYSPVDLQAMRLVANGEDSTYVALLPSGFAIVPDGPVGYGGPNNCNNAISVRGGGGSLLTVGFQILVSNLPSAKLTVESIETVKNLISCTIERIKSGLKCT